MNRRDIVFRYWSLPMSRRRAIQREIGLLASEAPLGSSTEETARMLANPPALKYLASAVERHEASV